MERLVHLNAILGKFPTGLLGLWAILVKKVLLSLSPFENVEMFKELLVNCRKMMVELQLPANIRFSLLQLNERYVPKILYREDACKEGS